MKEMQVQLTTRNINNESNKASNATDYHVMDDSSNNCKSVQLYQDLYSLFFLIQYHQKYDSGILCISHKCLWLTGVIFTYIAQFICFQALSASFINQWEDQSGTTGNDESDENETVGEGEGMKAVIVMTTLFVITSYIIKALKPFIVLFLTCLNFSSVKNKKELTRDNFIYGIVISLANMALITVAFVFSVFLIFLNYTSNNPENNASDILLVTFGNVFILEIDDWIAEWFYYDFESDNEDDNEDKSNINCRLFVNYEQFIIASRYTTTFFVMFYITIIVSWMSVVEDMYQDFSDALEKSNIATEFGPFGAAYGATFVAFGSLLPIALCKYHRCIDWMWNLLCLGEALFVFLFPLKCFDEHTAATIGGIFNIVVWLTMVCIQIWVDSDRRRTCFKCSSCDVVTVLFWFIQIYSIVIAVTYRAISFEYAEISWVFVASCIAVAGKYQAKVIFTRTNTTEYKFMCFRC